MKLLLTACCAIFFFTAKSQDSRTVETSVAAGKGIFEQNCLACHQADGSGIPNLAPPLIKGIFVGGDKGRLISILLEGMEGVEIRGEYYANPMPSFGFLSDEEIADVLTFVRSNFSNKEGPVTASEVQEMRKK